MTRKTIAKEGKGDKLVHESPNRNSVTLSHYQNKTYYTFYSRHEIILYRLYLIAIYELIEVISIVVFTYILYDFVLLLLLQQLHQVQIVSMI